MKRKQILFDLPVAVFRDGETYVAHCPAVDLSSYGDSEPEALRHFKEAWSLFLEECTSRGTLTDVLTSLGWTQVRTPHPHWKPPKVREVELKVPLPA